jgi:site-specific recombinase XerD
LSIQHLKNKAGEVTSVRAVALKVFGRQVRTTFNVNEFGSLEKAETAAERWIARKRKERSVDRHTVIAIPDRLRPDIIEALELLEPYSVRLVDAVREWVGHKEREMRVSWTFGEAAKHFIQSRRDKDARPEYLRAISATMALVAKTFGDRMLDQITTEELEAFLRSRGRIKDKVRQPISPVTWRNYRRDIRMVFRFAIEREHATRDPAKYLPEPQDEQAAIAIFNADGIKTLLNASPCAIKGILAIMAFSGLRPFEALRLPPDKINLDRGYIEVSGRNAKSRTRRLPTIGPNLARWLERYPVREVYNNYWLLRQPLKKAAQKAGLALSQDVLRHSFGSHHLALHQSAAKTAHEMGNSERIVYRHYREIVTQQEALAYFDVLP